MNLSSSFDWLFRWLDPARVLAPLSVAVLSATASASINVSQGAASDAPAVRTIIESWGCTNCHEPDDSNKLAVAKRPGPSLSGIGARNSADWLKRWIANPARLQPGASMPRLFGDSAAENADLDALVNFLASLGGEAQASTIATEDYVIAKGRELYHTIGCVNCHGALDSPAIVFRDEFLGDSIPTALVDRPLSGLDGKWYPAALSQFLRDPLAVHLDGRMPNMGLDESESDALANYLLTKWKPATTPNSANLAQFDRGMEVLRERNCLACHTLDGFEAPTNLAPALAALDATESSKGCLALEDWDGPRYDLTDKSRVDQLARALRAAQTVQPANPRLDYLERQVTGLNCRACHEIDDSGGIAEALQPYSVSLGEDADLGDEGRFPPHLNGVGNKLTTSWFKEVLQNSGTARPYLATRMPQFGHATDGFAELFAEKDGVQPDSDIKWPEITDEMLLLGRDMVGNEGITCVNCHSFGDSPALGTPGPDIQQFAGRLRYEWWTEYIQNPEVFKPGTRMPKYTDDAGRGVFTNYCNGDFKKQTDAMWAYFSLGEFMPTPAGMESSKGLMLTVEDRPRVIRTYLSNAGTRGIAVGFPVGIHYAINGATGRLVEVWQGEFLDASAAWAGRGGGTTGAEGKVLWKLPSRVEILIGEVGASHLDHPQEWPSEPNSEFHAYRLAPNGTPVFRSRIGDIFIEETILPSVTPDRQLTRQFQISGLQPNQPVFIRATNEPHSPTLDPVGLRAGTKADGKRDGEGFFNYGIVSSSTTVLLRYEVKL